MIRAQVAARLAGYEHVERIALPEEATIKTICRLGMLVCMAALYGYYMQAPPEWEWPRVSAQ